MSRRFSREEKGKATAKPLTWNREKPIRLPDEDDSELIEAHKLTLIGRVTNPEVQKINAVIGFLPQVWHLEGKIIGKELGREKFLFKFQSEVDLQRVLSKAPFHFKKWMVIIQRWEPIFSDAFPCYIPFWIKTPTLPINRWTSTTFKAIGDELGKYLSHDAEEGMVQVQINALKPLCMKKTIQSSSGREMTLELEYTNLGKHCFYCHCLSHEAKNCREKQSSKEIESPLGFNQRQTLQSIEEHKQQVRDRKRHPPSHQDKGPTARYHPYRRQARPPSEDRSFTNRTQNSSVQRISKNSWEEDELNSWNGYRRRKEEPSPYRRYDPQPQPFSRSQAHSPPVQKDRETSSLPLAGHTSEQKRTSSPDSKDNQGGASSSRARRSALERIENPIRSPSSNTGRLLHHTLTSGLLIQSAFGEIGEESNNSRNRRPALERIEITSPEFGRTLQSGLRVQTGLALNPLNSEDLQEITVQYLGDEADKPGENPSLKNRGTTSAQRSANLHNERLDGHLRLTLPSTESLLCEPIAESGIPPEKTMIGTRTQSRRRVPQSKPAAKGGEKAITKKKPTPKSKPPKGPGKQRIPCSPLLGASSRKRNSVRKSTNTKKKLYVDQTLDCTPNENLPLNEVVKCNMDITSLSKTLVSSSCKGSMVFQKPSSSNQ